MVVGVGDKNITGGILGETMRAIEQRRQCRQTVVDRGAGNSVNRASRNSADAEVARIGEQHVPVRKGEDPGRERHLRRQRRALIAGEAERTVARNGSHIPASRRHISNPVAFADVDIPRRVYSQPVGIGNRGGQRRKAVEVGKWIAVAEKCRDCSLWVYLPHSASGIVDKIDVVRAIHA